MKKSDSKGICVKIADFGLIAIHKFSEQLHTQDQGTPKYTVPEVRDSRKYDTKADIYSLGIIFQNLFDLDLTRQKNYLKNSNFIQFSKFSILIFQFIR